MNEVNEIMSSDSLGVLESLEVLVKMDKPGFALTICCYDVESSKCYLLLDNRLSSFSPLYHPLVVTFIENL